MTVRCKTTGRPIEGSYSRHVVTLEDVNVEGWPDGHAVRQPIDSGTFCSTACLVVYLCRRHPSHQTPADLGLAANGHPFAPAGIGIEPSEVVRWLLPLDQPCLAHPDDTPF